MLQRSTGNERPNFSVASLMTNRNQCLEMLKNYAIYGIHNFKSRTQRYWKKTLCFNKPTNISIDIASTKSITILKRLPALTTCQEFTSLNWDY